MPELPDVEIFKRYPDATSLHQKIEKTQVPDRRILSIPGKKLLKELTGRRTMVEPMLMNQKIIAGIGNIDADEILFQAGVHPKSKIDHLEKKTLKILFHTMKDVLQTAVDRQANRERFSHSFLLPYRNQKSRCPRCGEMILRTKVMGRTTYYCRKCQKNESVLRI